ncbi:type I restriction-modification system subunit M [Comamonas aquatica]|uniref:type I restriction-modification system subunit M n=1 Tax=Comamonas aquatica TaxID=225991 RepID=UPI0024469B8F|nr:N-6 DNA methylase [Comamonas aquatica]MDH0382371.1 N-6 DNA methylase [Comamonas aquatica]MDH0430506.1 N-6 DNA methylase [Comamonas aquatica]MDH0941440.1 N-6 DNA methylase [Comamonas aquatica]
MNVQQLENELWEAADQLRANSKLTAAEYAMPVLGLIFLRHADNRFKAYLPEILEGIPAAMPAAQREELIKTEFQGKSAVYLPEAARFDAIASLPTGEDVGAAIEAAMDAIEAEYPVLQGALPRGYSAFETDLLDRLVKIFDREALKTATGDVFGRIYEYFLNKFAMSGAQEGGEFFTPPSLVRMIVNVIQPDHGIVFDPACGSAGMFVQTGHFIEQVRHASALESVTFHGQEKSDTNTKLARMNLVVHGLDASNISQGNTFYDQAEHLIGQCDFVMANPPFNVDGVETKKVIKQVAPQPEDTNEEAKKEQLPLEGGPYRLPFGLPGTNAKTGAISNANSLWLQYFYSYLNNTGRAGFVMASSASDAGNKDRDIREKLVNTGHVDVMMSIGTKFFYTRSLPCTLWFFDKGKGEDLQDQVLMIDARNVYHVVSARSHIFTEEQLANLTAITWLYRGENDKFVDLVASYQRQVDNWLATLPSRLRADTRRLRQLALKLMRFARDAKVNEELLPALPVNPAPTEEQLAELTQQRTELQAALNAWKADLAQALANTSATDALTSMLELAAQARTEIAQADLTTHAGQKALQVKLDALTPILKAAGKSLEARHKRVMGLVETAEKTLRARNSKAWYGKAIREARRALQAADVKKHEAPTVRDLALEAPKQAAYFIQQVHKLHSYFPDGYYADVPGLCKAVTREEIAANDYSLTPGRYVGVAAVQDEVDEDAFAEQLREIHEELAGLNDKAVELAARISGNVMELLA